MNGSPGHIVLIGLGRLGVSILEVLYRLGERVTVISRTIDEDWRSRSTQAAGRVILRDARDEEALAEAGIGRARSVIIATGDDLVNLEIALDVQRWAPMAAIVLRLHDQELAERVRRNMRLQAVFSSEALTAPAFVAAAVGDRVLRAFTVEDAYVQVLETEAVEGESVARAAERMGGAPVAVRRANGADETTPAEESCLELGDRVIVVAPVAPPGADGRERERRARRTRRRRFWSRPVHRPLELISRLWQHTSGVMRAAFFALNAVAIVGTIVFKHALNLSWLNAVYFTVAIVSTIGFGDISLLHASPGIKVFGIVMILAGVSLVIVYFGVVTDFVMSHRFDQALGRPRTTLRDHVVVAGLGHMGHRIATRLHALGHPVLAVERNAESPFIAMLPPEIPVLHGDALKLHSLEQAGVDRARAVVACTDDDLANLRIAYRAKDVNPRCRAVVRLFHTSVAGKLGQSILGLGVPLNPSQAAATTFVASALAPGVAHGFTIGRRLMMVRVVDAAASACEGACVGALRRSGRSTVLMRQAPGDTRLRAVGPGDTIGPDDRIAVIEEYDPLTSGTAPCRLGLLWERETRG